MGSAWAGHPVDEREPGGSHSGRLTIQLLGAFQVSVGDRAVDSSAWRLRKATHLVKLLALTPGHRLHRDQLIDALWPEDDPETASSSFHQALHAARRALEPDRAARSTDSLLQFKRQVLALAPTGGLRIDVEAFQDAATRGRAAGDIDASLTALRLYAGDLLPEELYESWTQRARESLRETYLELLLTTARLQEASGASAEAIDTLRRLIRVDPLNEGAYALLMRLQAASGRRDQALRLYQQLSDLLREELDANPSPELTDLFTRIGAGELAVTELEVEKPTPRPQTTSLVMSPSEFSGGRRISLAELASQDGMFNRHAELELLQHTFDAFWSGQGQIVLLAGEPGIGKTRLAEEFAHYAELSGASSLWARCHEAEGVPAFWPWLQIVRSSLRDRSAETLRDDLGPAAGPIAQVVPDVLTLLPNTPVPPQVDSDQARFRFFDGVTAFLGRLSERQPLVLIIDDLHWADRSSLLLLEFLADEIAARRILLVGTYREADAPGNVALTRALERLIRSRGTHRVQLSGLALQDTALYGEFIAGRPLPRKLVETIYQRTNGNPYFAREIVRLLSAEGTERDPETWSNAVPLGVREAVTLRLDRLSDDARQILIAASVIGVEFQLDVLAEVTAIPVDQLLDLLEEAVALGVIAEEENDPDRFRFSHVLVQQTLYSGLIAARRTRMHARVGTALERLYGSIADPPYAELARHFFLGAAAGEAERAVRYVTRAGEQSMARLAYAEAAGQFRRAVEVLERYMPDRQEQLFNTLLLLARSELAAGESSEARANRLRSVDVARALGNPERLALAALEMVDVGSDYPDWRASEETALLEEALAALPAGDSALRVQVMSRLAHALVFDKTRPESEGQDTERGRLVREAVAMARRTGRPELIADALRAAHDVLWTYEDVDERIEIARELLALASETVDPRLELAARAQLTGEFLIKGLVGEADHELDIYEAIATSYHLPVNIWSVTAKRAMRAFMRGNLQEAERLTERARGIGLRAAPEVSRMNFLIQLFVLRREQDRQQEVERTLNAEAVKHPAEPLWQCMLAVLYADRGLRDEASRIVATLLDENPQAIPRDSFWLASLALLADACATLDDQRHAATLLAMMRPHAGFFVCPGNHVMFLGPVSLYLGRLATTLEQWDDAADYLEGTLTAARDVGSPIFEAVAQWALADMLVRREDPGDRAGRLIDNALEISERHGLVRLNRLAAAEQDAPPTCHSP